MITIKGSMVVQWLALLPHKEEGHGFKRQGFLSLVTLATSQNPKT